MFIILVLFIGLAVLRSDLKQLSQVDRYKVFGMLIVYCLRNVDFLGGVHGIPEIIAIVITVVLHLWRRQMLLSIAGGTVCYMLLLHYIA